MKHALVVVALAAVATLLCFCQMLFHSTPRAATSAGDISSVFNSLSQRPFEWPAHYATLKQELAPPPHVLESAWSRLLEALEPELALIHQDQGRVVPQVQFSVLQTGRVPDQVARQIRKRGVVVVRGVVPEQQARDWKIRTEKYAADNPSHVGFPAHDPQVLELYWSEPQIESRQHPSVVTTMKSLSRLWTSGPDVSFEHLFSYGERLRIRKSGDTSFSLGPHMDAGSMERFEPGPYREHYRQIFNGKWEDYNPFMADKRVLHNSTGAANGGATVFRAFQGWLALSAIASGSGTLRVMPLLRESTAFMLMRPFLSDVAPRDFCGAFPSNSQDVLDEWHSKLLETGMVSIPKVSPGDMVFWHPDLIHAVEPKHNGVEDSAVFYMPVMPATRINLAYIRRQAERFKQGRTPPDFPPNDSEVEFIGRATEAHLSQLGRRMLGLEPIRVSANPVAGLCALNEELGFDVCAA